MRGIAGLASRGETRSINDSDVPWISRDRSGGTYVDEQSALNFSAVWACETLIADAIATLPVDVFESRDGVRQEARPPRWLDAPSAECGRIDYETQRILSLIGWGNAWSMLSREGGHLDPMAPVMERWAIEPWRVQVRRVPGSLPATFVDGQYIPPELIQHVKGYCLPGALTGMSVIEHARQSLKVGLAAESFGAKFFENGVTPSGVLEIPQLPAELNKDVIERLREQFAERYAGTGNAYRPVALVGGTTWKQITVNPSDAQFLETRRFQIEEVCRWFRVPPHKVQSIANNASQGGGNGLEQMSLEFAQNTLQPWVVRLEEADTRLLGPGEYLKYNLNAYVRVDLKTRYEAHEIAIRAGMATPNSRLALEDEQPIVGGDYVRLPLQTTLLTDGTASIDLGVATVIGGLVRAGYEPNDILRVLGLPPIKHTGTLPVTVQAEPDVSPLIQAPGSPQ